MAKKVLTHDVAKYGDAFALPDFVEFPKEAAHPHNLPR